MPRKEEEIDEAVGVKSEDRKEKKEKRKHKEEKDGKDKKEKKSKEDKEEKKEKKEKKDKKEKKEKKEKKDKKDKKDKEEKKEKKEKKEESKKEEVNGDKKRKADELNGEPSTKKLKQDTTTAPAPASVPKPAAAPKPAPAATPAPDQATFDNSPVLSAEEWRNKNRITVPAGTPSPYQTFEQCTGLPPSIIAGLKRLQYTAPTPIQAQTWPIGITGKDMVGIAETGSGKTMAFLLPALVRFHELKAEGKIAGNKPAIVVLSPTRELAQQIYEVAVKFLFGTRINAACLYGGESKGQQLRQLRSGCALIIGTPGRVNDMFASGHLNFSEVFYSVLDEADRMLDMGFEPQIRQIFDQLPTARQTMMFTATFPKEIRAIAYSFQNSPVMLQIGTEDLAGNKNITQKVYPVEAFEKYSKLKEILTEIFKDNCRILVFANTKRACDSIAQRLWDEGFPVNAIHGDLDQHQRNKAMSQFKDGALPILFATDVAARGLDVKGVKHVINADFPNCFENYVHRIGRTGRAGEQGTAHSLVCVTTDTGLHSLVEYLVQCDQEVPTVLKDKFGHRHGGGGRGRGGRFGGRGGRNFGGRGGGGSRFDRGGGRGGGRGGFGGSGFDGSGFEGGSGGGFGGGFGGGRGGGFGGGRGGGFSRGGGRGGFSASGSETFFC